MPSHDRPPRRLASRLLLAAAGVLVAAVLAEIALRVTHWGVYEPRSADYYFQTGPGFWTFDRSMPPEHTWDRDPYGRLPPGAKLTYALNSYGLRGRDPVPGRPNVLFVGDSFTFGEGVRDGEPFVDVVGQALGTRMTPAPQTVNAGVPGYGSVQEAARLPSLLEAFRPRAVVVVYVPNDPVPVDDSIDRNDLLAVPVDAPALRIVRLARAVLGHETANRDVEQWYESYYFGGRRAEWDRARDALAAMKRASEAAGARFGVVHFPLIHRLSERPLRRIEETVAAACRAMGAPYLDLTPVLAREPDRALWLHPTDHHPDPLAHRIAADAIAPFVEALLR